MKRTGNPILVQTRRFRTLMGSSFGRLRRTRRGSSTHLCGMSISPDSFAALDDVISRLAGESILAQVGRDEGLIPAYSLLGELCELSAAEPSLHGPAAKLRGELEKLLDEA